MLHVCVFCFPITISVTRDCVPGFLFREACDHLVPGVGLSKGELCPQNGVDSERCMRVKNVNKYNIMFDCTGCLRSF